MFWGKYLFTLKTYARKTSATGLTKDIYMNKNVFTIDTFCSWLHACMYAYVYIHVDSYVTRHGGRNGRAQASREKSQEFESLPVP